MKISLSFDNGPDPEITPRVLDVLAEHQVKATFFILGKNIVVPEVRRLAERAHAEGHHIGNHSYNHLTPFGLLENPAEGIDEILSTDALLGDLGGNERLYRPFGRAQIGHHLLNRQTWDMLIERQFTCVLWTFVVPERLKPFSWMEPTFEACESQPWSVIVMHVIPTGGTGRLGQFLTMAADRGVEFSQDFPPDCTPVRKGVPLSPPEPLIPTE